LALIAGLAPCETGQVSIGGKPVGSAVQGQIAWIGQKPHVFAGSITRNVTLGRPDMSTKAAADALEAARLGSLASAYARRPLGDGGAGLSGGEALRLAIARAAGNPDASIILADEPTAHLDAETADEITESLLVLARGKTLVIATHDPRLSARMMRTIRIDADAAREAAE
jgi:ABC-type transport system involved in cytochrome bd biosynthesis fused ATPase/permease subunit